LEAREGQDLKERLSVRWRQVLSAECFACKRNSFWFVSWDGLRDDGPSFTILSLLLLFMFGSSRIAMT